MKTKNEPPSNLYPGFPYQPYELSAFHLSLNSFVISLKSGELIRFTTEKTEVFLSWLREHNVKDIR